MAMAIATSSLKVLRRPLEPKQFAFIDAQVKTALAAGEPVISVDAKKKELVGDFKNGGRAWRPKGLPEAVRVHDVLIKELGREGNAIEHRLFAFISQNWRAT